MQWAVAHLDELRTDGRRVLVRRHFGISAFGVNTWDGAEPGDLVIDEHDELVEGHEELYLVLSGRAIFTLDDRQVDAPAGTFVFVQPAVTRGAVAAEAGTRVLALGGPPDRPFSPAPWEEWSALGIPELLREGRDGEAAERYASLLGRYPDHAGVAYNLACLLSRAGRDEEALAHLRRAIDLHAPMREYALDDADFDPIRSDPRFADVTRS